MAISRNDLKELVAPAAQTEKDNKLEKQGNTPEKCTDALPRIPRRSEEKNVSLAKINFCDFSQKVSIGRGSFATVFKALYQKQVVAIKKNLKFDEFSGETKIIRQLASPGSPYILQSIGLVETDNLLVSEYMVGGDLWNALERRNKLNWTSRLRIAFDVSSALSYLHHKDLVHGDIKSHNILLDENNNAKLTDFGLTHSEKSRELTGAFPWMAPELFSNDYTSKTSDIYSLGILFAELAFHSHVIVEYSESSRSICEYRNSVIANINRLEQTSECPSAFANLIRECLDISKTRRPTIQQVIERLLTLLMLPDPFQPPTAHPIEEMREALTPRKRRQALDR